LVKPDAGLGINQGLLTKIQLETWVIRLKERGVTPGGINMYVRMIDSFLSWLKRRPHPEPGKFASGMAFRLQAQPSGMRSASVSAAIQYVAMRHITRALDRELKKGSAELLVLSLVEGRPRHGYEIGKLIEQRSDGRLRFKAASLYPLLYRLEHRGWIAGRWVEKPGERRRRFYRLTAEGKRVLAAQRDHWREFVHAIARITGVEHA
jgi:PadR family transcriptional regulator, regulatory protein PadR